jgi:serine/threonine protein kinase
MSAMDRRITDYILANARLLRDYSSQQLADALKVSQSSIVKYSQRLGYKGYPVDIWSAGVCLYAMLYGNVPFKANQMGDLNKMILDSTIEFKDTVSEEARDLMVRML